MRKAWRGERAMSVRRDRPSEGSAEGPEPSGDVLAQGQESASGPGAKAWKPRPQEGPAARGSRRGRRGPREHARGVRGVRAGVRRPGVGRHRGLLLGARRLVAVAGDRIAHLLVVGVLHVRELSPEVVELAREGEDVARDVPQVRLRDAAAAAREQRLDLDVTSTW